VAQIKQNLKTELSIVILAGGKGSRMGFKDKGLLDFKGKKLIEYSINLANKNSKNVVISCNNNLDFYKKYGDIICDDNQKFLGALAGISSALNIKNISNNKYLLVLAVDTPNINQQTIDSLYNNLDDKTDICVVFDGKYLHPTLMILKTKLKTSIDNFLQSGERKLGFWIKQHNFKKVLIIDKTLLKNINYLNQLTNFVFIQFLSL